jgi:hypothetical protein
MSAAHWPLHRRVDFANDQAANLLAVDGPAKASKNDAGRGEWLPSWATATRVDTCRGNGNQSPRESSGTGISTETFVLRSATCIAGCGISS